MRAGGYTRVDFDANLTVRVELEMFFCEGEEILDLLGCQIGGSAAAPVELNDGAILRDAAADALHLLLQHLEVWRGDAFVFLNDDVASAEETEAFAEGNVHIERNRCAGPLGFSVHAFEIGRAEGIIPDGRGWIAGIAWPGTIVFCEKFLADMELAAHLVQTWMCECHAESLLPHRHSRSRMLNQRALTGLDKELSVFDRCILQNAVAEVENVTVASQRTDGGQRHVTDCFGWSK